MKILFIPVKSRLDSDKNKILEISKKLPKEIAICYSIQYQNQATQIKNLLSKNHNVLKFIQVLGCSRPVFPKKTKAILLISDGKFHAVSLAIETKLPVYIFSGNKLEKVSDEDISKLEKKKKAAYVKFLNADKVGILVSAKPGQQNLKKAIQFKETIKQKKAYLFVANNISTAEFENFPQIQSWVNTACPRMDMNPVYGNGIVNINNLKS